MTEEQIGNILRVIGTANVSEEQRGSATADVLQLAAETFTKQVFRFTACRRDLYQAGIRLAFKRQAE